MRPLFAITVLSIVVLLAGACNSAQKTTQTLPPANPAAPGFDLQGSDAKAILIADEVMQAMGGRQAWDQTGFISWNFFGTRTLQWDKKNGYCRIEWLKKPLKVIVNLNGSDGKVQINGIEQISQDSIRKYLDIGRKVWVNDSYWLVMPFKLKDSGVTLKYLGESSTDDGKKADLLQMTFKNVGFTPDNKYHVWVDKSSRLVTKWAYFEKFTDETPKINSEWSDYQIFGKIKLSQKRGKEGTGMAPVTTAENAPAGLYEHF